MKYSQLLGIAFVVLLLASCFTNWVIVPKYHIALSGISGRINNELTLAKPINFYAILGAVSALLFTLPKVWAKRTNIFITAILFTYTIFIYMQFTFCRQGECPQKLWPIFLQMPLGFLIMLMSLLPNTPVNVDNKPKK